MDRTTDQLLSQYKSALLEDVVPWWQRHSVDEECGTYFSFLDRQGRPTSGHKFTWAIARQAWMFSWLCKTFGRNDDWLEIARDGVVFLDQNAIQDDGRTWFRFDRVGNPLADIQDVNTRCYIVTTLAEYAKASGEDWYADNAIELYESVFALLGQPTETPLLGYPLRGYGFHVHADDMVRLSTAWVLNESRPQDRWENNLEESCRSIVARHWHPELDAFLENVAYDGSPVLDIPEGRMIHPGHAMESAWMMMESGRLLGEQEFIDAAVAIVNSTMRRGWDEKNGGICYLTSIDADAMAFPPSAHVRLWWVHAEALCATLAARVFAKDEEARGWHEKVHDYTFARFPDAEHGEWFGWLGADGAPIATDKANGWKGCFHVPRALARAVQWLEGGESRQRKPDTTRDECDENI